MTTEYREMTNQYAAAAAAAAAGGGLPGRPVTEREARFWPGLRMLVLGIALLLAGLVLAFWPATSSPVRRGPGPAVCADLPGQRPRAGGADRGGPRAGPRHPAVRQDTAARSAIRACSGSTRSPAVSRSRPGSATRRSAQAKVNDADGNPIEIAAVVVWQVRDTASAMYSVDDFTQFVTIQTETAVRHIASSYPYDNRGSGALSLRDNAEEITGKLSAEIADRVAPAGVHIIESRLTRLSYAAEIAQAMLRQQQASAVVGARQKIVEGAVGMVQLALQRLQDEDVVELDEERKAAMVSNLLVVLCSEQATQPVVNTGSLYQ